MHKADPLIRTKLRLPFTRPGLVSRPRLQGRLAAGLRGPLTLIVAPAGFGKTTLAAAGLAASGLPVAWLSLDKSDNLEGRFLTYLIAALQSVEAGIGVEAAQLLAAPQPALPEAVLGSLINDLDAGGREIALALDDYQFIHSQTVHDQVTFFLDHLPTTLHLVIATRSDPPLPLARWRARGLAVELRMADLRFTEAEAAQFLNEAMGLDLDAAGVAALEKRTEGWIAGLQMAALSMRDRLDVGGFIAGFSGTNRYILDYLLEEVLAGQPAEIERFLLYTAILERLCAPLCDALLVEQASAAPVPGRSTSILETLERQNLFLISLDDERAWFRYHHLFADLLNARLDQAEPGLAPVLHRRAAGWLEQNGWTGEAIQHLLAAGDLERAADLLDRHGPQRWALGDLSIMRLADSLPGELLAARPRLGFCQAWLLLCRGNIAAVRPLLAGLAQLDGPRWLQTLIGLANAFLGEGSPANDPLPDYALLDELPAGEQVLRDAGDMLYAMTLSRRGEMARAVEVAARCIQRDQTDPGFLDIPYLILFLARAYLLQGRLTAAEGLCRDYLDSVRETGIRALYSTGGMKVVLGEVLYERNLLEASEAQIRAGLRANEAWVDIMSEAFGLLALVRVLQARGDHPGALQVVEKFENRLQLPYRPREFEEDFRTLRARVQLAAGDLQSAAQWANQVMLGEDFRRRPELYRLTLARLHLAQGQPAAAEALLRETLAQPEAGNLTNQQIEIHLLLAAAFAAQQRPEQALERIAAALALAEPEGYLRVFVEAGAPVHELLVAYQRAGTGRHLSYAQKIIESFPLPLSSSSPAALVEPLSSREREVLGLMAQGKSNPEIARLLVVAPGTIKAHAASIYRKLGAANRTAAVLRARQLGYLP